MGERSLRELVWWWWRASEVASFGGGGWVRGAFARWCGGVVVEGWQNLKRLEVDILVLVCQGNVAVLCWGCVKATPPGDALESLQVARSFDVSFAVALFDSGAVVACGFFSNVAVRRGIMPEGLSCCLKRQRCVPRTRQMVS